MTIYDSLMFKINQISAEIEITRNRLEKVICNHKGNLLHKEVMSISKAIDNLLNKYYYLYNLLNKYKCLGEYTIK